MVYFILKSIFPLINRLNLLFIFLIRFLLLNSKPIISSSSKLKQKRNNDLMKYSKKLNPSSAKYGKTSNTSIEGKKIELLKENLTTYVTSYEIFH